MDAFGMDALNIVDYLKKIANIGTAK